MGSPSRNVQYHPPRLSEDRLNLPQPHSPSLPTHCTAPGNRECARLRRAGAGAPEARGVTSSSCSTRSRAPSNRRSRWRACSVTGERSPVRSRSRHVADSRNSRRTSAGPSCRRIMRPKQVSAYGVESRPPLRPTGVFLAVVRRRDRHRRAPGGANVDRLQAVAPHPPGQVAHEGARRVANRGGAHRALQHGGEEGAEELVRDDPQLLFALLRFLCRPGRWSTRLKLQRPPEGSAQVDGNVAKIDLAARGVDGLVHFNAPSWAVRAVMSSNTLPVCPKTGSTSPGLTVHLCLHTVPGNRECALLGLDLLQVGDDERGLFLAALEVP